MLEFFFGKKTTDKLVDSIAEKASEKIAKSVAEKPKLNEFSGGDNLDIKKKQLEIALLEMDKEKREQEAKAKIENPQEKFDGKNEASLKKTSWYRLTSAFIGQKELNHIQVEIKKNASPQEIQGLVQAIGQVRAARIIAMGAIVATGVGGAGLWIFQQVVSQKNKELEQKENELVKAKSDVDKRERELSSRTKLLDQTQSVSSDSVLSLGMADGELRKADEFVDIFCKKDSKCLNEYKFFKEEGRREGLRIFNEKVEAAKRDAEKENLSLKIKQ